MRQRVGKVMNLVKDRESKNSLETHGHVGAVDERPGDVGTDSRDCVDEKLSEENEHRVDDPGACRMPYKYQLLLTRHVDSLIVGEGRIDEKKSQEGERQAYLSSRPTPNSGLHSPYPHCQPLLLLRRPA
jgi:hypothetical protein